MLQFMLCATLRTGTCRLDEWEILC